MQGITAELEAEVKDTLRQIYTNLTALSEELQQGLPGEDLSLMLLIGGISRLNSRHFDQQLKELGFTRSQWLVLDGISRREGVQQNALASSLNMRKAPLGVLVDELKRAGWVQRRVDPTDRRARQLFLSTQCQLQMESLHSSFADLHGRAQRGISDSAWRPLHQLLQQLRENLQDIASESDTSSYEAQA
jgi:DNA-binding MarR family transcriptional regulator